jgi:hypothetical protein
MPWMELQPALVGDQDRLDFQKFGKRTALDSSMAWFEAAPRRRSAQFFV